VKLRFIYLYRNLTRNSLRTVLTLLAVALPIIIYVMSAAVINGVDDFLDESAKELRLAVTHRASVVSPLPHGYRAKIESLDPTRKRILSVCGMRWIGGRIENDPRLLSTLAVDADTFAATFPNIQLTEAEIEAWHRDPTAIIVGPSTADQFGWKVGDRITILPSVPPYTPIEFNVVSTAPKAKDRMTNFCRLSYIEEALRPPVVPEGWQPEGWVSFIFVKCATQSDLEHYRKAIDELFARTPDETKTQDEKTFMNEYITQLFNLPRNLRILAAVTIFVAVLAAANTMGMNLRDRMNETAVLKSLGFGGTMVFGLIQAESLMICGLGGAIGAAIPFVAFNYTALKNYTVPLIQTLIVESDVCGEALLVALGVGLIAGLWPAWTGLRLPVVSALRNLE